MNVRRLYEPMLILWFDEREFLLHRHGEQIKRACFYDHRRNLYGVWVGSDQEVSLLNSDMKEQNEQAKYKRVL